MAKVKEIEVSVGITVEVNKKWVRTGASMKIEVNEENTPEKREKIYDKAYKELTDRIDKAIEEALK